MGADLAAKLIEAGLITRDEIEEIIGGRALAGAELIEALLAANIEEDAILGYFVAEGYGPLLEAKDLLSAETDLVHRFTEPLAMRCMALPLRTSPAGTIVAMADPSDLAAAAEMEEIIGPILPTVAKLSELRAAISDHYQNYAQRISDAVVELRRRRDPTSIVPLVRAKDKSEAKQPKVEPSTKAEPFSIEPRWSKPIGQTRVRATKRNSQDNPQARISGYEQKIRAAKHRDQIVETLCEAVVELGYSAAFLAVRKQSITGWHAAGRDVSPDAIRTLRIPASVASVLQTVAKEQNAYCGPYGTTGADQLLKTILGSRTNSVFVMPLCVRDLTIGLLCVDGIQEDSEFVSLLQRLVESSGEALSLLIVKQKTEKK